MARHSAVTTNPLRAGSFPRGWPTDPNINFSGTFIGDYNGLAASAHAVHPIWTDARRVVCQLVVTDCQKQQDAVTATVSF